MKQEPNICTRLCMFLGYARVADVLQLYARRTHSVRRLKRVFDEIDADKDGRISFTEFKAHMRKASPLLSRMAQGLFTTMDSIGNGHLSFKAGVPPLRPMQQEKPWSCMAFVRDASLQCSSILPCSCLEVPGSFLLQFSLFGCKVSIGSVTCLLF